MSTQKPATPKPAGREPVANKKYAQLLETDYFDRNRLAISPEQKAYLEANGLVHRYIRHKDYLENNNFHKSGWKIIPDTDMPGANAEGLVKVGDSVLAVRTKGMNEAHKADLDRKNRAQSNLPGVNKKAGKELAQAMKERGLSGQIHTGYEENGDSDDGDE